jgi:predicted kinase
MNGPAKLIFFCGKMAAGKSTLARKLAAQHDAILLVQDEFLATLFPGQIAVSTFIEYSSRVRRVLAPYISALLSKGITVVLVFRRIREHSVRGSASCSASRVSSMSCTSSKFPM